ncbi:hypothetical protein H102_07901 [Trichophyton rubrum CBS 100081]|uniref:Uncharacterized protein n=2 Tax=Trichophyton rubrum TaxID=5551 RepID=F2SBP5_TRIRC|nr:uncharacterized protein TERG_00506 [Trichophyton rubrum CBS 118892]EGD84225.2 hypothetical protein TERG_00506 [Trichophyton rubrum CBS 118892]EZF37880.1 hypothetical protein H102_07901 [Trichophyton rubrum CBS 100081]EZF59140.1 hypothetical protein H104_07873 [Trichophyton rubrum CBS 289.86]
MADSNARFFRCPENQSYTFYPVPPARVKTLRRPASLSSCNTSVTIVDTEPNNDSLLEEYTSKLIERLEAWDRVQKANTAQNLTTQSARINFLEEALQAEVRRNKALKVHLARQGRQIKTLQQTIKDLERDRKDSTDTTTRLVQKLEREVEILIQNLSETTFLNNTLKNQNKNLQEVNRQTFLRVGEHKNLLEALCVKLNVDVNKIMRDVVKDQGISLPAGWKK